MESVLSICIVAYNEEHYLPGLLRDIKAQMYPHNLLEIILVDSMSTDSTRKIMEDFRSSENEFYAVKVVLNTRKIQASGWNEAIKAATGEALARIDAHTHLPSDYSIKVMQHIRAGENIVGGKRPCIVDNGGKFEALLLETENSLFGSGISFSRRGERQTYVKTMFHATYRRSIFAIVGGFNENLLRTEDNEMHYRIRANGFKLLYDPQIVSYQYARNSLKKMIKQKYGNGYWVGLTLGVAPKCISLYHLVPWAFVLAIVISTVLYFCGIQEMAFLLWIAYGLFSFSSSIISAIKNKRILWALLIPPLFLILHVSYGVGTLVGMVKMPFCKNMLSKCQEINIVKETVKIDLLKEK